MGGASRVPILNQEEVGSSAEAPQRRCSGGGSGGRKQGVAGSHQTLRGCRPAPAVLPLPSLPTPGPPALICHWK